MSDALFSNYFEDLFTLQLLAPLAL